MLHIGSLPSALIAFHLLAQVQCELEVALKPRAERNAAASSTALAEAVQKAEQALSFNTASHKEVSGGSAVSPTTSESDRGAVANLLGLVQAAKGRLAEEAAEQVLAISSLQ